MYREPFPLLDMHTSLTNAVTTMRLFINSRYTCVNWHRCNGLCLAQCHLRSRMLNAGSLVEQSLYSFRIIKRRVLNSGFIGSNASIGAVAVKKNSVLHFPNSASMHCHGHRRFSTSTKRYIAGLCLVSIANRDKCYRVGISLEKISTLGRPLEYISFTTESRVSKGDFLFSIEANKTLYEFISPWNADILEINPTFCDDVDEHTLQGLLADPESLDNYLMILHAEEI